MSRVIALALLLTLATVTPVVARSATPVPDPHLRDRIAPPRFVIPCAKPGHACRPIPIPAPR